MREVLDGRDWVCCEGEVLDRRVSIRIVKSVVGLRMQKILDG